MRGEIDGRHVTMLERRWIDEPAKNQFEDISAAIREAMTPPRTFRDPEEHMRWLHEAQQATAGLRRDAVWLYTTFTLPGNIVLDKEPAPLPNTNTSPEHDENK